MTEPFHLAPPPVIERGATLSPCGTYRYRLWRTWDSARPPVVWVMLNPSTADARNDDPTIRRCVGFARAWGRGGIVVVNLFAWRSPSPSELLAALSRGVDVVGPENDRHMQAAAGEADLVVAAWGARGEIAGRAARVRELLVTTTLHALRVTRGHEPEHPLYLPRDLTPQPWEVRRG